ncbi:hypothetical protein B0H13DRAFT_2355515 [Mycena leptocephala]|nr:hypothetical protein B0H13DRAFT_2355515 [Mycena leptocephala]
MLLSIFLDAMFPLAASRDAVLDNSLHVCVALICAIALIRALFGVFMASMRQASALYPAPYWPALFEPVELPYVIPQPAL